MRYTEAIQFLYNLRWFGTKLGLANTFKLAELAGNPQQQLRFIHVAGTNGKGSTCAMLESIYRVEGLRTGLFTSPHLVSFGERIQVNRQPISELEVVEQVLELQPLLQQFPAEEHPTFFEVVTVMALRYFAAQKCDLVIWETGLGGRLDATNIVTPLASVITNIQYDHQQWLGETLALIAAEKAGIVKRDIPVITSAADPEALEVIAKTAKSLHAPLRVVTEADTLTAPLKTVQLPLLGEHQRLNAALALATIRALSDQIPVGADAVRSGFASVNWPGRLQLVRQPGEREILLDGAHNVAGARMLADALQQYFHGRWPALVLGILRDKDWPGIARILGPSSRRILLTPVSSERSASPVELESACREANPSVETIVCGSAAEALEKTSVDPFVLVTGSLYLVGEALEHLEGSPGRAFAERSLNEWNANI
jgi:dihydrofolate synthase/folylpolyglutamate synthase